MIEKIRNNSVTMATDCINLWDTYMLNYEQSKSSDFVQFKAVWSWIFREEELTVKEIRFAITCISIPLLFHFLLRHKHKYSLGGGCPDLNSKREIRM